MRNNSKLEARRVRHWRIRRKVVGTAERPRLSVFRGGRSLYVQVIDDIAGRTLFSLSTRNQGFQKQMKKGGHVEAAALLGRLVGEGAVKKGIKRVVFDRGGFIYHGRIKALAEGAREKGLEF